jgi:hypothetical protein
MQFSVDSSAAQKISDLLKESGLRSPIPSLCDVIFEDQGSEALTAIRERISDSRGGDFPEGETEALRQAVEAANSQLWINVFEKSDYAPDDLIMIGATEFAIPSALRSCLDDAKLIFDSDKFYVLRDGQRFTSIQALCTSAAER